VSLAATKLDLNYQSLLLENVSDAIISTDVNFYIKSWNKAAEKIYGWRAEDVIEKHIQEVLKGESPNQSIESIPDEIYSKGSWKGELIQKHKDGFDVHIRSSVSLIKDNEGKVKGVLTINHDITKQKEAEQLLKESKERYRMIIENANDLITILNHNFKHEYINEKAYIKQTGFSKKDIIGKSPITQLHPDDIRNASNALFKGFKNGEGQIEFRLKCKNGDYIWLESKGKVFTDINGEKKALIISRDITKRKEIERKFKDLSNDLELKFAERTKQLETSETKFQVLFNNSTSGIAYHKMIYDIDGNPMDYIITDINPKGEIFLSIKKEDIINKKATEILPDGIGLNIDMYSKVANTGESTKFDAFFPPVNKFFQISVISSKKGEFILVFDDISKRKKWDLKLRESENRYKELINHMSSGVAVYEAINNGKDFIFKDFNLAGEKIDNYKKEELVGKSILKTFPGVKEFGLFDVLQRVWKTGKPEHQPISLYKDNRITGWRENYVYKLPSGEIVAVFDNVTERKIADQKLKESEEKFRTIADHSMAGISIIQDNKIKYINQQSLDYLGYSKEEVEKWEPGFYLNLIHPEDRENSLDITRKNQSGESLSTSHTEKRALRKDGETIWIETYSRSINYEGRPAAMNISINITKKKKAEEDLRKLNEELEHEIGARTKELKESEEKFRKITEESLLGILILQDNKVIYANQEMADLYGYSVEEILNWKPGDHIKVIASDSLEMVMEQAEKRRTFDQNMITHYQIHAKRKDGTLFWVDNMSKTINYEGHPAVLVTQIDITDKIIAEQKLKESEEKFRNIFESIPMGMHLYELDSDENLVFKGANPQADKILKVACNQFVDKTIEEAFPPLIETDIPERYRRLAKNQGSWKWEQVSYEYEKIQGAYEVVAFHTSPNKMVTTFMDISDRIEAAQKLKESEEKFRTIAEQSFMGICILQDNQLKYVNEAAAKMFEYTAKEVLKWAKNYMAEKVIHPDDLSILRAQREQRRLKGFNFLPYITYRIITKSGKIKWIEQYSKIILYQRKEAELVSFTDITENKEAERLILERNKKLLELDKMREDIITRVSHELKTPLTSAYAASQILLSNHKEDMKDSISNYVQIIHRGNIRLKKLIENLLDASRIEFGKFDLNKNIENLGDLINESLDDLYYLANNRQLKLNLNLHEEIYFAVDKTRIEQAITNLISNAIKNTQKGGEIFVNAYEKSQYIDISIKDTGIGLKPKEIQKLFEKFGKIERYGKDMGVDLEGSGLGLYISQQIVALHNGEILVESEGRNKGSTFTIRLYK